jgi:hypothetical protein
MDPAGVPTVCFIRNMKYDVGCQPYALLEI